MLRTFFTLSLFRKRLCLVFNDRGRRKPKKKRKKKKEKKNVNGFFFNGFTTRSSSVYSTLPT